MPVTRFTCSQCKVYHWISNFPTGNLTASSVCYFCSLNSNINDIKKEIQDIKDLIKNINSKSENEISNNQSATSSACNVMNVISKALNNTEQLQNQANFLRKRSTDDMRDNDDKFINVVNGAKPKVSNEFQLTTFNPFSGLEIEKCERETVLIGSSMVKNMDKEFVLRNKNKRKCKSYSGATISDVKNELKNIDIKSDTLACTMIGSNDIYRNETNTNDLIQKYKDLLKTIKEKSKNVLCFGILPRNFMGVRYLSKAMYFNHKLEELCTSENVFFANLWSNFSDDNSLFRKDGVHLNDIGDARLGRLIDMEVKKVHKVINDKDQDFRLERTKTSTKN